MSLRGHVIEETATLPDGTSLLVRVGVAEDPYIRRSELETVSVELLEGDTPVAAVNTILGVEQESEARALALEIVAGLESGELEPTAGSIEPLADSIR